MWMSAALRKNTPRISSAERGAVAVNAVGMQKISELDPAGAVRAIAPLYTSLDFISAGAAPQDGKKPKGPTTARQALRPPPACYCFYVRT
jgi:hypothetical protein